MEDASSSTSGKRERERIRNGAARQERERREPIE